MSRYTDYAARVAADGGVITDATDCAAIFTMLEANSNFADLGIGVSARWGVKLSGSNITKFYNIADNALDGATVGTIARDTSGAFAFADFGTGASGFGTASIVFPSMPTNPDGKGQGCLWKDETVSPNAGFAGCVLHWTDSVYTYHGASGPTYFRNPKECNLAPEAGGPTAGQTSGSWVWPDMGGGVPFVDGVAVPAPGKAEFGALKQTVGASFVMDIIAVATSPNLTEMLFYPKIGYDQFAALAALHAGRY